MGLKPCLDCGRLTNTGSRCPRCQATKNRERDQQRGTTTQRGYGTAHRKLREQVRPQVEAGHATCWRCGDPINPREPWDLGHDDQDRTQYRGPEHVRCNRATNRAPTAGDFDDSRDW